MKLEIDIPSIIYNDAKENRGYISVGKMEIAWKAIADGKPLEQEPRKGAWLRMSDLSEQEDDRYKCSRCGLEQKSIIGKIRAEIQELDNKVCQQFLIEDVDKEVHRAYQYCLGIIDKAESEKINE